MDKMWITASLAPCRAEPGYGKKLCDIPYKSVVEAGQETEIVYSGFPTKFRYVSYRQNEKTIVTGWVYAGYLESYHEEFPSGVLKIDSQTEYPHDAQQYIVWRNKVQYNLCGQLSVMYCHRRDMTAVQFLELLNLSSPSLISRLFPNWIGTGTSVADLLDIFKNTGYTGEIKKLSDALMDRVAGRAIQTPGRYAEILKDKLIISSCRISKITGKLTSSGIGHWVVLELVTPDEAARGWVLLFNPFNNKLEKYQWDVFIASAGAPYGIVVERK